MKILYDTDILSMLGKVGKIGLLEKIFSDHLISITFEVYSELLTAKELGYDFVDNIFEHDLDIIQLDIDLNEFEIKINALRKIHHGEFKSILLCKKHDYIFVTNDKYAKHLCDKIGVNWLDIGTLLRMAYIKKIIEKDEILKIIREIEARDRTKLKNIKEIFKMQDENKENQ